MAATSSSDFYLAKELIIEILSWMPVTSLLRFKSVCKTWFSIISSPAFIETHLSNSKKKQPSSFIWLYKFRDEHPYSFSDTIGIHTIVDEHVRINIPRNFIGENSCFCSCNGLLLLHHSKEGLLDSEVLFIWNPLTRWFRELRCPIQIYTKVDDDVRIGFGFDFISNDYKILTIESCLKKNILGKKYIFVIEAEVYSVNSDSWKEIQVPDAVRCFSLEGSDDIVHANGVMYLVGTKEVLAFDLHCEVFRVFSFPNPLQLTRMSKVFDHEDSVAMIFGESDDHGSVLSLWTLDDVSWTKKFNLQADLKVLRVFLYLGAGLFVVEDCNWEYIVYDHGKKQTKKFPLRILHYEAKVASYTESLVSLPRVPTTGVVW